MHLRGGWVARTFYSLLPGKPVWGPPPPGPESDVHPPGLSTSPRSPRPAARGSGSCVQTSRQEAYGEWKGKPFNCAQNQGHVPTHVESVGQRHPRAISWIPSSIYADAPRGRERGAALLGKSELNVVIWGFAPSY